MKNREQLLGNQFPPSTVGSRDHSVCQVDVAGTVHAEPFPCPSAQCGHTSKPLSAVLWRWGHQGWLVTVALVPALQNLSRPQ